MPHEYLAKLREGIPTVCYSGIDKNLKPGAKFGPITRDVYIFECNISGYGSVVINDRTFPISPGDCYILFPGDTVIHTVKDDNPRCGVWCAAEGLHIGKVLSKTNITSLNPYAPPELFDALTAQISAIADMQNDTDSGAELRRTGHLYNFLGILLQNHSPQGRANWLTQVIGYMETYYNSKITVETLAKEAHLERSYFSIRFRQETGMTPHSYLNSLRIQKACSLMSKTQCSVSETAELVGLDSRNFSRLFRRETGMTPTEFLKIRDE